MKGCTRGLPGSRIREQSFKDEANGHYFCDTADAQRAVHDPSASRDAADAATAVSHGGKLGDVKEVRPAQIVIAEKKGAVKPSKRPTRNAAIVATQPLKLLSPFFIHRLSRVHLPLGHLDAGIEKMPLHSSE